MKKIFLLVGIGIVFFACGGKKKSLLIKEDQLVKVLADVHVAEAAAQVLSGQTKDSILEVYYGQIFEIHDVKRADFDSTMLLLREDPIRLEKVYIKVLEELSEQNAKAEGKK